MAIPIGGEENIPLTFAEQKQLREIEGTLGANFDAQKIQFFGETATLGANVTSQTAEKPGQGDGTKGSQS